MNLFKISLVCLLFISKANALVLKKNVVHNIWEKSLLNICFGHSSMDQDIIRPFSQFINDKKIILADFNEEYKEIIKETLEAEFSEETTKVHFKILGSCGRNIKHDIIIQPTSEKKDNGRYNSQAARNADAKKAIVFINIKYDLNYSIDKEAVDKTHNLKSIFVHELVHTFGVSHEFFHYDFLNDKLCKEVNYVKKYSGSNTNLKHKIKRFEDKYFSPYGYDSKSIMSYCYIHHNGFWRSENEILSPMDKDAIYFIFM
ncbi:MAG: hypothetical protein HOO06_08470 [Bdellovibrionaceae bacterium]|jgi:hypothetical protein|nr:hypothetical protein [Pseudobdellovibrionaceae bacterium]